MSIRDIENWNTTNPLRSAIPYVLDVNIPFNTTMGLNEDNTNAGYIPAINPTSKATPKTKATRNGCKK